METERAPRWGTESPLRGRTSDRGFQPPTALEGSSARRSLRMRTNAIEAITGPTSVRTNTSASSIAPRWRRVLMGAPKMSISGEALDRSDGCTSGAWLGASACGRVAGLGTQTRSRQSVRCNGFCPFPRGIAHPNFGVSIRGVNRGAGKRPQRNWVGRASRKWTSYTRPLSCRERKFRSAGILAIQVAPHRGPLTRHRSVDIRGGEGLPLPAPGLFSPSPLSKGKHPLSKPDKSPVST